MSAHYVHRSDCRVCGGTDLVQILDLGRTPPANAYLRKEDLDRPEESFPLVLWFCRTCSLVQLLDVVDPRILFKDYHYVTGASPPLLQHFETYAREVVRPLLRSRDDLVIDIGGNDGTLLSYLTGDARVLNIDPADNLAPLSEARGVPFHAAFFNSSTADEILGTHGPAAVVTANNVFAHTDPIRDVFAGVAKLIGDDGAFIVEVHWARHLVDEVAFDQIYHEHLCFWSLHAMKHLVESVGLRLCDVDVVKSQGLSLRITASRRLPVKPSVNALLAEEKAAGLTSEAVFHTFARRVALNKAELLPLLRRLKAEGKRITGYGAPAKGNTLLNYYGIGPETLDYLTDLTPLKQGLYSPGMHIPIVAPDRLYRDPPEFILLLAWNFKDAILAHEKALREQGVKFIVTVPEVAIL